MRRSLALVTGLFLTTIAGCTSSNRMSALDISPSAETTASISKPSPPSSVAGLINETEALVIPQQGGVVEALNQPMPEKAPVQVAALRPERPSTSSRGNPFADRKVYGPSFRDAKPINFGRVEPDHYEVHGVDVSRWQGRIDWKTLRTQGANFAFIKATDGGDHIDPMFKTNWDGAGNAGIARGAYHFMYWCRSGEAQAKWFIRNVPKVKGALPPVLDAEWNNESKSCRTRPNPTLVRARMKVFLEMVERHYGQKPIIYTAPDFYDDNLRGHFKEYSFWLRAVAEHPKSRYPGQDFAFWQYTGTGKSKGVSTHIDLNVFNGTEESWKRWLAKSTH